MMLLKALGGALIMVATWFVIFVIMFLAEPGHAQTVTETAEVECAPHGQLVAGLAGGYGEMLFAVGTIDAVKMETWVNPETLTWTFVVVRQDGIACMLASGSNFSGAPNA